MTKVTKFTPPPAVNTNQVGTELGISGVKISNGFVYDEFLYQLRGQAGRKIYREMADNNATISGFLYLVEMIARAATWYVTPNSNAPNKQTADDMAEFVRTVLFEDMTMTWDEFLRHVLTTMLIYGWQYSEIVYKRRNGFQSDMKLSSKYEDGLIGFAKLADRAQETLWRWEIDRNDGTILGMWQLPPQGHLSVNTVRYIPLEKALLFRPRGSVDNPEGRSILRGVYRSWHILKNIQEIEVIAIERELNGLPVIKIPNEILNAEEGTPEYATKMLYVAMGRDIKFNDQGSVVIPSNTYINSDGSVSDIPLVSFQLMASEGTRSIDTHQIIKRYEENISRTVGADFIMLGTTTSGSRALAQPKIDMFINAVDGLLESITEPINKFLIPKLWRINNLPPETMPTVQVNSVKPINLTEIGQYVSDLARAGIQLFPDIDLENELRDLANFPERSEEMESEFSVQPQEVTQRTDQIMNGIQQPEDVIRMAVAKQLNRKRRKREDETTEKQRRRKQRKSKMYRNRK